MIKSVEDKIWTGPFLIALTNNFFLFTIYYALLTVLPVYIISDLKGSEGQAGLAMTMFMISAIIVRPFAGKIIETLGKRKTLLISQLFFCLSSIMYIFIDSLPILLSLRLFHGIWFSIVTTVLIAIANDLIPDNRKGAGLGYFAMSSNLAVVTGPFIGLTIFQWFSYEILMISLSVAIVVGYLFAFTLRVTEYRKDSFTKKKGLSLDDLIEIKVLPIATVGGLTAFAYSSIMTFISVYAVTKGLYEYVTIFFIIFAISMIVVRPFTGRLYDTKGPSTVIYPSFIFFALGLILLAVMNNLATLLIAGVLIGIGYGSIIPCFQAVAIQAAEKHRSGHATSTFFTLFDSGMALGAFVLGIVSAKFGYTTLYLLCGIIVFLTVLVFWALVSRKKRLNITESMKTVEES